MNETVETIFDAMPASMRRRMMPVLPSLEQAFAEVAGMPPHPNVVVFVIATEQASAAVAVDAVPCAGSSSPVVEDESDRALIQREIADLINNRSGADDDDFARAVSLVFALMTEEVREGHDRMVAHEGPGIPIVVTLLVPEQGQVHGVTSIIKMAMSDDEVAGEGLSVQ